MVIDLKIFEDIVRVAKHYTDISSESSAETVNLHPFDERNIHPEISKVSISLFDDGHFSQATFEAFKYIDKEVLQLAGINKTGVALMMAAFNENNPKIQLNNLSTQSEKDEQKGFSFLFSGGVAAIRNPRGHEVGNIDTVEQCLDHLSLASFLVRRIKGRVFSQQPG